MDQNRNRIFVEVHTTTVVADLLRPCADFAITCVASLPPSHAANLRLDYDTGHVVRFSDLKGEATRPLTCAGASRRLPNHPLGAPPPSSRLTYIASLGLC